MTDDAKLIERLRAGRSIGDLAHAGAANEAASRIEALIAERDRAYEDAATAAHCACVDLAFSMDPETLAPAHYSEATGKAIRSLKDKTDAE